MDETIDRYRCRRHSCSPSVSWLPVILCVFSLATFVVTYIVSILMHHVSPLFPYISDTGTTVPESCIFSLGLSISAFLAMSTMYVRYKMVDAFQTDDRRLARLNVTSLILGAISDFGLLIVAAFQETSVIQAHITGALLVFGGGVVYCILQTIITYKTHPAHNSWSIFCARLAATIVTSCAFCTVAIGGAVSYYQYFNGTQLDDKLHWQPRDSGYDAHVSSTAAEWIMGITFQLFFLTYVGEFRRLTVRVSAQLVPFTSALSLSATGAQRNDRGTIPVSEHSPLI